MVMTVKSSAQEKGCLSFPVVPYLSRNLLCVHSEFTLYLCHTEVSQEH